MNFRELDLPGVFAIETDPFVDERGRFERTYCTEEFAEHGLEPRIAQISVSTNSQRGTLRGLHLQLAPSEETKVVRCIRGAVFDVLVDLRPDSPAFGRWVGIELRSDGPTTLYVARNVAHGFLTLEDDTQVEYLISAPYAAAAAVGLRWDDPALGIRWPFEPLVVSERDRGFADVDLARIRSEGLDALR